MWYRVLFRQMVLDGSFWPLAFLFLFFSFMYRTVVVLKIFSMLPIQLELTVRRKNVRTEENGMFVCLELGIGQENRELVTD